MIEEKYDPLRGLDFDEEDDIELVCFKKREPPASQPGKKRRLKEGEYARYRKYPVTVRMTQEEKARMEECFAESGFRKKQNYIIQALCQKPMATDKEISDLEAVLKRLDALYDQLRRIGTNINQITVRMHADKIVPEMREIKGITTELRKEVDEQWRSIKSQLQKLQATQR